MKTLMTRASALALASVAMTAAAVPARAQEPAATSAPAAAPAPARPAWVERSDAITRKLLKAEGGFVPEGSSQAGLEAFDGRTMQLTPDFNERVLAFYRARTTEYQGMLAAEKDPQVRQDLQILIDYTTLQADQIEANTRLLLDWTDVPQFTLGSINALLSVENPAARQARARDLLRGYIGATPGTTPLVDQARASFLASRKEGRLGPYRDEVQQAIDKTPTYVAGVRALFKRAGLTGADKDLDTYARQMTDYAAWERKTVLPAARTEFRLPPELYALRLRQVGIDIPPQELVARATRAWYATRTDAEAMAGVVGAKLGLQQTDYLSVIKALKKGTIPDSEVEQRYREVNAKLEDIVRTHGIATLPDSALKMRLATAAEAAAQPAPHMDPPRMVGNTGEQGTFVLTTGNGADAFDDFNFDAATWSLSAHEARPGHELQFARMVARGVSLARALYAFNSVNVEGWALYAESEVMPYEPVDGQLVTLKSLMQREARAMLDPMLNLGQIDKEAARSVLIDQVGLSKGMADQEIDRYTFRSPGQAGSYFYGYQQLVQLQEETRLALGDKFDHKAFNDFVVDQGILPPKVIAAAVREQFVPAMLKAAAK